MVVLPVGFLCKSPEAEMITIMDFIFFGVSMNKLPYYVASLFALVGTTATFAGSISSYDASQNGVGTVGSVSEQRFESQYDFHNSFAQNDGFFIYKRPRLGLNVAHTRYFMKALALEDSSSSWSASVFQRIVQHFMIDLASDAHMQETPFMPNELVRAVEQVNASRNWLATISAMFVHTWKEIAFRSELQYAQAPQWSAFAKTANAYRYQWQPAQPYGLKPAQGSMLAERAEVSYKLNDAVEPFLSGAMLQSVQAPGIISAQTRNISSLWPRFDANIYGVGAGLALNFKRYQLRLEEQRYQSASMQAFHQSTVSLHVNFG